VTDMSKYRTARALHDGMDGGSPPPGYEPSVGFVVPLGESAPCVAFGHNYQQGAYAPTGFLYNSLLYCSKCGDVRELKLEEPAK